MTAKEKRAYEKWNREMTKQGEARDIYFKAVQDLYAERGGGKPIFSLEAKTKWEARNHEKRIFRFVCLGSN